MDFGTIENSLAMEYLPVIIFILFSLILLAIIIIASLFVAPKNSYFNKLRQYESGFNNLQTTNRQINIRFYIVSVLFLVFDIEIIFMYPWAVAFYKLSTIGFTAMMVFFTMLVIGFLYEIKKGALSWN